MNDGNPPAPRSSTLRATTAEGSGAAEHTASAAPPAATSATAQLPVRMSQPANATAASAHATHASSTAQGSQTAATSGATEHAGSPPQRDFPTSMARQPPPMPPGPSTLRATTAAGSGAAEHTASAAPPAATSATAVPTSSSVVWSATHGCWMRLWSDGALRRVEMPVVPPGPKAPPPVFTDAAQGGQGQSGAAPQQPVPISQRANASAARAHATDATSAA